MANFKTVVKQLKNSIKIIFSADLNNLTPLIKHIESYISQHTDNSKLVYKVQLVVDEVVTNIIKYGYKQDFNNKIILTAQDLKHSFKIIIKDNAKYFNPFDFEKLNLMEYKKERKAHGLGIYLVKKYTDKLDHEYNNGNILVIKIFK